MTPMQTPAAPAAAPVTSVVRPAIGLAWQGAMAGSLTRAKATMKAHGVRPCDSERAWHLHHDREAITERKVVPMWLRHLRTKFWVAVAEAQYRSATHSHRQTVRVATPEVCSSSGCVRPSAVGLPNAYAKKGYSVATSHHAYSVSATWVNDVHCRRAAVVGGLLTLDLARAPEATVPTAYAATWVEQSRGTELRTVRGWLVQTSGGWVHADTLAGAQRVAKRLAPAAPRAKRPLPTTVPGLLSRAGLAGGEMVSRLDAVRAGHCRAGISDWVAKRGLEVESVSALHLATLAIDSDDRVAEVLAVLVCLKRALRSQAKQEVAVSL